jgi:hypothetical protein
MAWFTSPIAPHHDGVRDALDELPELLALPAQVLLGAELLGDLPPELGVAVHQLGAHELERAIRQAAALVGRLVRVVHRCHEALNVRRNGV